MVEKELFTERQLASLAKQFREQAGKTRSQAARELGVSHTSVFNAEEKPEQSLLKVRARMIKAYSLFKVIGPRFQLVRK